MASSIMGLLKRNRHTREEFRVAEKLLSRYPGIMTRSLKMVSLCLVALFSCGDSNGGGDTIDGGSSDGGSCCDAGDGALGVDAGDDIDAGNTACVDGAKGLANFSEHLIDDTFVHGQYMKIVDVDLDGANDVLVAYSLTDSVHLYLNRCTSWQLVRITPPDTLVVTGVAAGDFDDDGDIDIAAAAVFDRDGGGGSVRWYENSGDVTGTWTEHNISGATLDAPLTIEAADLSGDGEPDLLVGTASSGPGVQWFRNTGGAFVGPLAVDDQISDVHAVIAHDIDGDGALDVVSASVESGEISWYESDRVGGTPSDTIAFTKHIIDSVNNPFGIALGNFDEDPALELAASNTRGIEVYDSPADPTQAWAPTSITTSYGSEASVHVIAADLDGNGDDDIAIAAGPTDTAQAYLRAGTVYTERQITDNYTGLNILVSGDIDGDGDIDLLTSTYNNADTDRISWWENTP